jgi:hypothetical protein
MSDALLFIQITYGRLHVVARCDSVKPISPNVRTKLLQREPRIMRDNALAQLRARFPSAARAEVEVVDARLDRKSESFALSGLGRLEIGSEVHAPMIDQIDLLKQIFLHVDQND